MDNILKSNKGEKTVTLLASRSLADGKGVFPRLPVRSPAAGLYEDTELKGTAKLYSFTIIHPNPKSGKPPFVQVLADFDNHTRVFGRLEYPHQDVRIGMLLEARASSDQDSESGSYHFVVAEEL